MQFSSQKVAGPLIEDLVTFSPTGDGYSLLHQFTQDQIFSPPSNDDAFVVFDGFKIFTGAVWPFSPQPIPQDDKDWLLDMFDATQAPGVAVLLFVRFKEHKLMDYVPTYLANPAFMSELGDELKTILRSMIVGKARNDHLYRYQRLLQQYPIMFETMDWMDSFRQDQIGVKLFKYGIPRALSYINPLHVTSELIHESIQFAISDAHKRIAPPSNAQYAQLYGELLRLGGQHLVDIPELVRICSIQFTLGMQYIRAKSLDFNTVLSIIMTVLYNGGVSFTPNESYEVIRNVYDEHGPSNQWPTLANVIKYVVTVVPGKVAAAQPKSPTIGGLPISSLPASQTTLFG